MNLEERIKESKITGFLDVRQMGLKTLPILPNTLTSLYCSDNELTALPPLPPTLKTLFCNCNNLTSLPTLPDTLTTMICYNNQLTILPKLPDKIWQIYCKKNRLTALPTLPDTLTHLSCYSNKLKTLPTLPDKLILLDCIDNQLKILPILPDTLSHLNCGSNPYNKIFANLFKKYNLNKSIVDNNLKQIIIDIRKYNQIIINAKNTISFQIAFYKVIGCDIPLDCFSIIGSYLSGEKGTLYSQILKLRCKLP